VSALTLQVLFDANADAMSIKAQGWLAMAEALDNATENLIRGSRDLEHVWPVGPATEAAHQKSANLPPLRCILQACSSTSRRAAMAAPSEATRSATICA
jgi:hypothetical protein